MDITETFLNAKDQDQSSVVQEAKRVADTRGSSFGRALNSMAVSLAALTLLLIVVAAQGIF